MHLGGPTEQLLIKSVFAGATSYWENTAGRNHLHFLNLPNCMQSNASSACLTSWRPEHWIHLTYPEMELESSYAILQLWAINDLGVGACSFCDNRLLSKGQVLTWETVRPWKDRRIHLLRVSGQYQARCLNFSDFFSLQLYASFYGTSERMCGDLQENMD